MLVKEHGSIDYSNSVLSSRWWGYGDVATTLGLACTFIVKDSTTADSITEAILFEVAFNMLWCDGRRKVASNVHP